MPYVSDAQRRFLHAKHPDIAARWDREAKAKAAWGSLRMRGKKRPPSGKIGHGGGHKR